MYKLRAVLVLGLSTAALVACTRLITEELPTQPIGAPGAPLPVTPAPGSTPTPTPVGTPTPSTSPTPVPSPTPTVIPTPTPVPTPTPTTPATPDPNTSSCVPEPPPLNKINVKVHNDQGLKKVLDSAPIVCSSAAFPQYCENMMKDPNRRCCPPRPEGHPQRVACDEVLMGRARDTGEVGPTWTVNGKPCGPKESNVIPRCTNNNSNQYLVFAFGPGLYRACAENGTCGEIQVK